MEILLLWLALAIVAGIAAGARGRSGLLWFVIAVLFSPLIALILLAFMPRAEPAARLKTCPGCGASCPETAVMCGKCNHDFSAPRLAETRPCPFCAEEIKTAAIVCKHCGHDIPPMTAEAASAHAEEKACPDCGGASPPWARVCRSCGRNYDNPAPERAG